MYNQLITFYSVNIFFNIRKPCSNSLCIIPFIVICNNIFRQYIISFVYDFICTARNCKKKNQKKKTSLVTVVQVLPLYFCSQQVFEWLKIKFQEHLPLSDNFLWKLRKRFFILFKLLLKGWWTEKWNFPWAFHN